MAQTITTKGPLNMVRMATGAYLDTGTVAAYTFTLGFKPRYVKVFNVGSNATMEYIEGMTDAYGIKTHDSGSGTTDISQVTSNGITVSASGFTFGLDTDVNITNEQCYFIALG